MKSIFCWIAFFVSMLQVIADDGVDRMHASLKDGVLSVTNDGQASISCRVSSTGTDAVLNWRHDVVIIPDNQFVTLEEVRRCAGGDLKPHTSPAKAGLLVDVAPDAGVYLALDTISASPISYLATVAKLGSLSLLVNLPGAYNSKMPLKKLQEFGFDYHSDDPPKLSKDGYYASPNGDFDCSKDAFPGVWDTRTGKKVVLDNSNEDDRRAACRALFGAK